MLRISGLQPQVGVPADGSEIAETQSKAQRHPVRLQVSLVPPVMWPNRDGPQRVGAIKRVEDP